MNAPAFAQLQEMLRQVIPRNAFWARKYEGVDWKSVADQEGLRRLPLTTKAELVADQSAHPPYGKNLTYSRATYSRLHQTSGTTGRPLRCLDTPTSWKWILSCWGQIYALTGISDEDVFAFPFSFGPFLGFWAAFEGAQQLGAMCLAGGGLTSEGRLQMIVDNSATVVCCTPTYALRLAETAEAIGVDLKTGTVRAIVVAGEPGGSIPQIRKRIETAWGARVFDHWGMTEIGPLAVEPEEHPGGIVMLQEKCIAEVIDPATGAPQEVGQLGELVVTNLGRWGQPLIRYRTGDLVRVKSIERSKMAGGGGIYLDGGVQGRTDDMFIVRGNNVFPSSVEAVIREFSEIAEYRMTLREQRSMPHLVVEIEPGASVKSLNDLPERLRQRIKDRLHFQPEIEVQKPGTLPRFELKGRRFIKAF